MYELLPIFCIRLAGRPFDHLEKLKLGDTLVLARELLALDDRVDVAAREALDDLRANPEGVAGAGDREHVRKTLGLRQALPSGNCPSKPVENYRSTFGAREELAARLQQT